MRRARRHRIAVVRMVDRRPQDLAQRSRAVGVEQPHPGVDRARHGDGVRALQRDPVHAPIGEPLGRRRRRRPPRAVEGDDLVAAPERREHEAVAADPGRVRLHDRLHGGRRDGGVEGVAPRLEHVDGGQGGERLRGRGHAVDGVDGRDRLRGRGHAVDGVDGRPPRGVEVTHGPDPRPGPPRRRERAGAAGRWRAAVTGGPRRRSAMVPAPRREGARREGGRIYSAAILGR